MKIIQGTLRKGRPMDSSKGKGQMHRFYTCAAAMFLAISGAAAMAHAQSVPPSGFFDWEVPPDESEDYNPSPFLNNNNASEVAAWLADAEAKGYGNNLAVKVIEPLTSRAAKDIFNQFAIKYVFCDFEDAGRVGRTRAIADIVLASTRSRNAFVGNFNSYPRAGSDSTRPSNTNPDGVADSFDERPADFTTPTSAAAGATPSASGWPTPPCTPGRPTSGTRCPAAAPRPTSGPPCSPDRSSA
jgi:hypothetical protein